MANLLMHYIDRSSSHNSWMTEVVLIACRQRNTHTHNYKQGDGGGDGHGQFANALHCKWGEGESWPVLPIYGLDCKSRILLLVIAGRGTFSVHSSQNLCRFVVACLAFM